MRTTVSLSDELAAFVDEEFASSDITDAQAIRGAIRRAQELEKRVAEQDQEIDDLRQRVERLEREKRLILEEREEKQELARYAEDQRTRQQRKDEAGIGTRAKWWIFGMDTDEEA